MGKVALTEESLSDNAVPIEIQVFLWKQISPFIRPKLGKLHEATCSLCQNAPGHHELKEACKTFEKVVVQNNKFGLKQCLKDSIRSIPRWRFIQAALPHVLHSCATLLHNKIKDGSLQPLGAVETKLLYSLHWILLDAAEECAGPDFEAASVQHSPFYYVFSIPAMTLFVYLFAPICHHLKESDFLNFRLENGLKIWHAMWEYRHPEALCFTTHCKPKPKNLLSKKDKLQQQFGDVFIGRKHSSVEVLTTGTESPPVQMTSEHSSTFSGITVKATVSTREVDDEGNWISSPKDTVFPETIPEESSSTEEEHVVIFRLPSLCEADGFLKDPSIYTAETNLFSLAMTTKNGSGKSSLKVEQVPAVSGFDNKQSRMKPTMQKIGSSTDKDSVDSSRHTSEKSHGGAGQSGSQGSLKMGLPHHDIFAATFLDVAVLRSLLITDWLEDGVYWGLLFIYNRLRDISEVNVCQQMPRRRSNSLPIPKIEISMYQSPELKKKVPFNKKSEEDVSHVRRASEKTKKRMKMADLKAFVETKILSKSDKALEKIGHDDHKLSDQMEYHRSLDTGDEHLSRPSSALSKMFGHHHHFQASNLIKGKSMPSLSCLIDELTAGGYIGELNQEKRRQSRAVPRPATMPNQNPIITVTEHTPTPSPDYMKRHGSIDSQLDTISMNGGEKTQKFVRKSSLTRSQTDSNISYTSEEIQEAPGSSCYITKEGNIDYQLVLKAVHTIASRDHHCNSLRVMEVILNLVELLMDLGVMKQCLREEERSKQTDKGTSPGSKSKEAPQTPSSTTGDKGSQYDPSSAHRQLMDIILKTLRHLGCPHGCNDARRGPPAEFLRTQSQNILAKLNRASNKQFANFLKDFVAINTIVDILDFFHAYVGFCVDPSSLLSPLSLGNGGPKGIESQVVSHVLKPLVTRFCSSFKQLKLPDNISVYCDVRQFIIYVKEAHGSTFRKVALSGLLDTADRPNKKESNIHTTRVVRSHLPQSDIDEVTEPTTETSFPADDKVQRKLLFKKRSTSSTCASLLETDGENESKVGQSPLTNLKKRPYILTPRQSERALGIAEPLPPKPKSKSKFGGIVNWFKRDGSNFESNNNFDISDDTCSFMKGPAQCYPIGKGTQKCATSSLHTLQKAKKRVEDRFSKFVKKGKKKGISDEDIQASYMSRKNSLELGDMSRESEYIIYKERRLVPVVPVYKGMLRFSFLLETCQPGSVPDAHLLAAVLDLPYTAVVARASLLLECAHFVHNCNKGQWPSWMKTNFPMFRPSGPMHHHHHQQQQRGPTAFLRRSHTLQRTAGKMFYQWAEALGTRLEEMIHEDSKNNEIINNMVKDEFVQKDLLTQDEEEDFLDEASINAYGSNCPIALRLIACHLLFEVTAFLRETYQNLPKTTRMSVREKSQQPEKIYSKEANRRWSMALSSMGHSQTSAQSLQSIAGDKDAGSSNTTVTMQGEDGMPEKKRIITATRPYLLRRGTAAMTTGGSFKRRSLKLRRNTKELREIEFEYPVKRTDSIQKRKVSSLSDRSDTSEPGNQDVQSGEESPGILSDEQPPESPSDSNDTDETAKNMPWMKTTIHVANSFNYYCTHQNFCHPYCYRRHMRACRRLIQAVRKVYGDKFGLLDDKSDMGLQFKSKEENKKDKNRNRKMQQHQEQTQAPQQTSPIRRKDSMGRRDRIDKSIDSSQISRSIESKESSRDIGELLRDPYKYELEDMPKEPPQVLKYLKSQVKDVFQAPISTLVKGAVIMTEEQFVEIMPVAWELLLEWRQEVAAAAASLFILAAVKAPHHVSDLMHHHLKHPDPKVRINAILRFQVLWKLRYQVWPRMEEGAQMTFKVPPPGIEFTLPSPKIGIESLPVVDPPWMPQVKTKVEEVTINEERHRSLVTATKTRKKQQTELIKMALQAQDDKKREERQNFLITTTPITVQAAYEPSLYGTTTGDDHDEGDEELGDGTKNASHHLHSAHSLFPSCLCAAVIQIVDMLDDASVSSDGSAVYEVAYQVIWNCLVEDSALFLRYVLERLTRDKQEEMFKILRHLIRFVPKLPQQAAFALYNYIIGYVMFYTRTPHEEGQKFIGTALSILWMVVHSVQGIMFKDLKQILRKEQCDASILLTANVPSAKKIVVHGPQELDSGGIPSQFPVQEDTQFCQILRESLDFFGVDEDKHKEYFLVDYKTHKIHNTNAYVRDFYFFKRSQYPQLELIHMKPDDAYDALQNQELVNKFVEIGKVLLTWAILKNVDMVVQRVVFLHEELMKLPAFPRKALESNLALYKGGQIGRILLGLDVTHKFMWIRLIARMFEAMSGNFAYSGDIHLFLNVLNGALIIHSEDSCILRYVTATYINAAINFKNIFTTNGYLLIIPTLLKIYSNHQTNKLVTTTVEYAVKQFYLMNRKPFILQMFGSLSAILDTDEEGVYGDAYKVRSSCLFNLLLSLETPSPDPLNIAELIKEEKPLKAIDFCYHDEDEMVNILDCISLCVMVVSYSADSVRGYQMLIILEAIFPCYLQHIQLPSYNKEGKTEKEIIHTLAVAIRTLVNNCEALTKYAAKSYNGPYRSSPEHKSSSQRNYSRGPYSPGFDFDEDSHSKYMSEHSRAKSVYEHDGEDSEVLRAEYRRPRDVLLSLVGDFIFRAAKRLSELNKKSNSDGKFVELLDIKSHVRLADIAHSLLKVSPYDPESMACTGLQRYMNHILPSTEWANDAMKPALVTILRRLDKVFLKISKKPSIRRNTDWDAAAGLLKGIYETMTRYPYIMHWQYVKALINTCQTLMVSDAYPTEGVSAATAALMSQAPPQQFCSIVIRLIALQILNTVDNYSLEQVCGGSSLFSSQDKAENMIINLIVPLCLRVGSGRKDVDRMRQPDISFALTVILHAMSPPQKSVPITSQNIKFVSDIRVGSLSYARDLKNPTKIKNSLYQVSFLALKLMVVCFEGDLICDWPKISHTLRGLSKRNEALTHLWDFLEFVVTQRTPLFILMQPFIFQKLAHPPISEYERHMHSIIKDKLRGINLPQPRCRGALLMELAQQIKELKEELEEAGPEEKQGPLSTGKVHHSNVHVTSEVNHGSRVNQRPSLIEFLTGGDHGGRVHHHEHNPHRRASLSSTSFGSENAGHVSTSVNNEKDYFENQSNCDTTTPPLNANLPANDRSQHSSVSDEQNQPPQQPVKHEPLSAHKAAKLRFVQSVEMRHSSGETSTTPLSPGSPAEESPSENNANKPRLQRSKAQSRKTFRLRRSRKSRMEIHHKNLSHEEEPTPEHEEVETSRPCLKPPDVVEGARGSNENRHISSPMSGTSLPLSQTMIPSPQVEHTINLPSETHLLVRAQATQGSYDEDSMVSQASSTSAGYREPYNIHLATMDSPKTFPPLASPDLHSDLPSTSSATYNNKDRQPCAENSSPEDVSSFNGDGDMTSLLGRTSSRQSIDASDETTLI